MITVRMDSDWNALSRIADALADRGYAIEREFLPLNAIDALRAQALSLDAAGLLRPAAIGRGGGRAVAPATRGDRIRWLDDASEVVAERPVRGALEALRIALNRSLALGLLDVEAHYAVYPPGASYARHVDRFRGDDDRVLSFVLYLNAHWRLPDGGALRLHVPQRALDIAPEGGTLVTFLSDRFEHEVLPATRERLSLTGWFRRRAQEPAARIGAQ
jgi:SM-20-related protein